MNFILVIREMVKNASEEIGFEFGEENVDQVLDNIKHRHGYSINENSKIDVDMMALVCETIIEWQEETQASMK